MANINFEVIHVDDDGFTCYTRFTVYGQLNMQDVERRARDWMEGQGIRNATLKMYIEGLHEPVRSVNLEL